jgi:1-pyrroline-5-carboxylate dehydrogenase
MTVEVPMKQEKKLTYVDLLADESIHKHYEKALEEAESLLGKSWPMFIGGSEVRSGVEFEVRSPFDTGILVGRFQKCRRDNIAAAIASARSGFQPWSSLDWKDRTQVLRKAADNLDDQKFLLSAIITFECGKNRTEALAEASESVDLIRYHANQYEKNQGYVVRLKPEGPKASDRSIMRPHGVFAVISPFNFPLSLATGMATGALLCGNTVVLKPTSTAPFSALKLYQALVESGVPDSAVQYLTGPGATFGEAIVPDLGIDGIAFTGSRDAGMWLHREFIAKQPYPKPVITEMGSKNPVIVTLSADMFKAAEGVSKAAFGYSGQKCSAASRVYVHELAAPEFLFLLREKAESLVVGDPRDKETFLGPVIEERARERFRQAVLRAQQDGGKIVTGGKVLSSGTFDRGFYVQPTVVTGLRTDHPLAKQELFVPFLLVFTFSTIEEALELANDTEYGLTAGIFSEDKKEIDYFFDHIRFGVTYANRKGGATTGAWPGYQSFGGWKASGSTGKGIGGPYYLLSYLREQTQTRIGK